MSRSLRIGLSGLAAAVGVLTLTASRPATSRRIAGTATMSYTQRVPAPVGDADGHIILQTVSTGTNQSTGPTDFLGGATVINNEVADLLQGNGTHQGYIVFSVEGRSVLARWTGTVSTIPGADQKPATSFQGTWVYVRGAKGKGTYTGHLTGPDSYTVDWQGETDGK